MQTGGHNSPVSEGGRLGPHNSAPCVWSNLQFGVSFNPEEVKSSNCTEPALLVKKKNPKQTQQTPKQTNDLTLVFRNTSTPASLQRRAPPACCDQGTRPQRPPCSNQRSTSTNPAPGAGSCSSPRSLPPRFRFFPPLLLLPA